MAFSGVRSWCDDDRDELRLRLVRAAELIRDLLEPLPLVDLALNAPHEDIAEAQDEHEHRALEHLDRGMLGEHQEVDRQEHADRRDEDRRQHRPDAEQFPLHDRIRREAQQERHRIVAQRVVPVDVERQRQHHVEHDVEADEQQETDQEVLELGATLLGESDVLLHQDPVDEKSQNDHESIERPSPHVPEDGPGHRS